MRSLDDSALELGGDLDAIVAYDERLVASAGNYGITVLSPR